MSEQSERRQATVVFADISGFTALSELLDPEELTLLMNRCFKVLERAVLDHGGTVDKYIGDCIMALFGVPVAIESAPRQAVNAAIEIRNLVDEFNRTEEPRVRLDVHVGINTGLVIAGQVGGEVKQEFTVLGDVVNLASRLKDASGAGQIFVGSDTHQYTRGDFEFRKLKPLVVKGKEQPVQAFEVVSHREKLHRPRTGASDLTVSAPLIGRDAELARLEALLTRLAQGESSLLSLVGEAGIGKSRITAELTSSPSAGNATFLEARALSIGANLSFHPFVDLFANWAGIAEDDTESDSIAKLERAIRDRLDDDAGEVFPFVATLMGMRLTGVHGARIEGIGGEAMEKLIVRAVRRLLAAVARENVLVVVFEDLHWADLSSVKLLESLLSLIEEVPLLFVFVFRPQFTDTSEHIRRLAADRFGQRYHEICLEPLPDAACDRLIESLLDAENLPFEVRRLICGRAEGNPFYIEEVVRSLIEMGALESRRGRLRVTEKIHSVMIPGTIQEVILARVDRLDERIRSLLQVASVIGRSFYRRVVAEVLGEYPDLDDDLAALRSRDLILERRTRRTASLKRRVLAEEVEYVFKHALSQETIYESILHKTRKELHRRVARSIESLYEDRLVDFHAMLAYHYSRAEDLEKAEEYLFKAGDEAARAAASGEALTFFREASRLYLLMHRDGGDPRKKALLEKNIGLALLNKGDLTESIGHFDAALELLGEQVPKSALRRQLKFGVSLLGVLTRLYVGIGRRRRIDDWDREREVWEVLFNRGRAEITSDPTRLFFDTVIGFNTLNQIDAAQIPQASAIYRSSGMVFCYSGISFDVSRKALGIARRLGRPRDLADEFNDAAMGFILHYLEGDWDDGHVVPEELLDRALRYGQLWDANTYIGLYCDRLLRQGDFRGARARLAQLAEINDAYGYEFAGVNRQIMMALLLLEERKLAEALPLAEAYQGARHERALRVLGLGVKAKIQLLQGEYEAAAATVASAEGIARGSREVPPWHLSALAAARLRHDVEELERRLRGGAGTPRGLRRQATRSARYAISLASKVAIHRVEVLQLVGRLDWMLGRRRRALELWRRSVAEGTRMRARPEVSRTFAEAGRLLKDADVQTALDGDDAQACLEKAQALFAELDLAWDLERVQPTARAA